jgi:LytS/YehU family sensor histidine kinase
MRPWAICAAIFAVIGLFFSGPVWIDYAYGGRTISWGRAIAVSVAAWLLWTPLAMAIVWLGARVPLARGTWRRGLAVHVPLSLVVTIAKLVADVQIARAITGVMRAPSNPLALYITFGTYWAILGVSAWLSARRVAAEREMRAVRLEAELARAQVQALESQLHPHFLFNTLNAVSGLMREDVEAADTTLTRLSELLRMTLDRGSASEVPLRAELAFLEKYVDILRVRFGPRLTVDVRVDPAALGILVPAMILQPLVENAMTHGLSVRPGPGRIDVDVHVDGGFLRIAVTDDGPGPPPVLRAGLGLDNTRRRLHALYAGAASLSLESTGTVGATARVVLPARTAPAEEDTP